MYASMFPHRNIVNIYNQIHTPIMHISTVGDDFLSASNLTQMKQF